MFLYGYSMQPSLHLYELGMSCKIIGYSCKQILSSSFCILWSSVTSDGLRSLAQSLYESSPVLEFYLKWSLGVWSATCSLEMTPFLDFSSSYEKQNHGVILAGRVECHGMGKMPARNVLAFAECLTASQLSFPLEGG